jgi:hypothetical protein
VGVLGSPWLPIVEPTLGFRSDVKSHFFNASFVGHLVSLPAGSRVFAAEAALAPMGDVPAVDQLYNYLVLMGADWGRLSLAGGTLYPILRICFSRSVRREIAADEMSPAVRVMYVAPALRVRAMYFRTAQDRQGGEGWNRLGGEDYYSPSPAGEPQRPAYGLEVNSLRVGVDVELPRSLSLSADQLVTWGRYDESGLGSLDLVHAFTSLALTAQFSHYVATRGYVNLFHRRYETSVSAAIPDIPAGRTDTSYQFGGALEFLF